jgi:integrase
MARLMHRLSARFVNQVAKPGFYADGGNLYLRVEPTGNKRWVFRYDRGRQHDLGLGPVHTISLADARRKALEYRKQLIEGVDPLSERRRTQRRPVDDITFAECARRYITAHQAGWKIGGRSAELWTASFESDVFPIIGNMPVREIETGHIMRVLDRIWVDKPVTASRIRARIESVLGWATTRGYRQGDNPARWRDHLENLLPSPKKVRSAVPYAAIPFDAVPTFLTALRGRRGIAVRTTEFVLLTAVRSAEALNARWSEINLRDRVWTIPPERTKTGAEHRVPLSSAAVDLLTGLSVFRQSDEGFVFPGLKPDRPLSSSAMRMMLAEIGYGNFTIHGLRAVFRTWVAERTNFAPELAEAALGHKVGTAVERAYRRGSFFERRRGLMEAWAKACAEPAVTGDVVTIGGRR